MQDRFKFRCWHKLTKIMYEVFDFNENFIRATPDLVVPSIRTLNAMDCVLIQCTGLKDKNGKFIYEGDIVRDISTQTVYKVSHKKCAFYLENKEYVGYFHELSQCFSISRLEVIGNIYENPELLSEVENDT